MCFAPDMMQGAEGARIKGHDPLSYLCWHKGKSLWSNGGGTWHKFPGGGHLLKNRRRPMVLLETGNLTHSFQGSFFLDKNLRTSRENGRFLKRTMEENGESPPKVTRSQKSQHCNRDDALPPQSQSLLRVRAHQHSGNSWWLVCPNAIINDE